MLHKLFGFLLIVLFGIDAAFADTCKSGYTLSDIDYDSLVYTFGGDCGTNSGFESAIIYNVIAYPIPTRTIKCSAGQHYVNGVCVNNVQDTCDNGFLESGQNDGLSFVQSYGAGCVPGYQPMHTVNLVSYVMSSVTTKCPIGYQHTANGCAPIASDNCPNNYYAALPTNGFMRADANDACTTNYSAYNDTDFCRRYLGNNMDEFCTPQITCTAGGTTLNASNGMVLPLYDEKLTTPSINIGWPNGHVCYVNLVAGTASGTINLKYNDETYHGVN